MKNGTIKYFTSSHVTTTEGLWKSRRSKLSTNQSFQFWTKRNKLGKSQTPKYTLQRTLTNVLMHHYFDPRPKRVYVCNEVHSSCPLLAQKHRSVDSPDQLQWVSYRFCLVVHSVHLFTLKVYESVFLTANARCFNCSASRLFEAVFWKITYQNDLLFDHTDPHSGRAVFRLWCIQLFLALDH